MFCPKGPSVIASIGISDSLTLAGLDRDNLTLRVQVSPTTVTTAPSADITFSGDAGSISEIKIFGPVAEFFRVPAEASTISYSVSSSTSLALGQDL